MSAPTTRHTPLSKQVSRDEMLTLREQGMSNMDIAKSLEISYVTVLKYIGKQDGRKEPVAAFSAKKSSDTKSASNPPPRLALQLDTERVSYLAEDGTRYSAEIVGSLVLVQDGIGGTLTTENLPALAKFCFAVACRMEGRNA